MRGPSIVGLSLHQPLAHGPHCGLRSVRDAELAQDVLHVFLDGLVADLQRLRDFLVRQAVAQTVAALRFRAVSTVHRCPKRGAA